MPATSRTGTTLSGECGSAMSGSSVDKSMTSVSSYSASPSAARGLKSEPLPCASRKRRVCSSLGKMDVVAPSSAPMFVIVPRSGTVSVETPSPQYSRILPTPPFTVRTRSTSRITSFAATHGRRRPFNSTLSTFGRGMENGTPAIARATSSPPAPMASIPRAPPVGVWLSEPRSVLPGTPNRSRCT